MTAKRSDKSLPLMSTSRVILGIVIYIVLGELLKDVLIFPFVEPILQHRFAPETAEHLSELSEYIMLAFLLIPIALYFVVYPINAANRKLMLTNKRIRSKNKRLIRQKNRLDDMFRYQSAVMLIIDHAQGGRIIDANNAALDFYGYPYEAFIKLNISDINTLPAEDVRKKMDEAFQRKNSIFIFDHRLKNGVIRKVQVHSTPMAFEDRQLLFSIVYDITEKHEHTKALQETEEKFRALFNQNVAGIYLHDLDGTILDVNEAACGQMGYSKEEMLQLNIFDLHPDPEETINLSKDDILKQWKQWEPEECLVIEAEHKHKDGFFIPMQISTCVVVYGGEKRIVAITQDITERKKMEERLIESQKIESIGNLAGGIAHDFNNILFPIVGISELLMEDFPPNSLGYDYAAQIFKAGKRGTDLVNQILTFSRQTDHKKIPVSPQNILKEVMHLVRSTIPSNITIEYDFQNDCGLIFADPTQIHQVAMNLVTNAYHAVEPISGNIFVTLKETETVLKDGPASFAQKQPCAMLTVADNGVGMDPETKDKIFQPYFTTKEQGKGTGLGLAVVYGIVKDHGGDIRVESAPGKGSTFQVYLPLHDEASAVTTGKGTEPIPTGSERILLVDDEESVVSIEKQMLTRLGYHVTEFTSSSDAVKAFRKDPFAFDLVISDMTMPNMTGDRLVKEMIAARPDIPIIICTGFSERIDKEKAETMGVSGLLMKPVVKSQMAKAVRNILDGV